MPKAIEQMQVAKISASTGRLRKDASGKIYIQRCYVKIDIQGKSYAQIKKDVERAFNFPRICFEQTGRHNGMPKITLVAVKSSHRVSIKDFLQNELNSYCNSYINKTNPQITFRARITNYKEREGCFEAVFNTIIAELSNIDAQNVIDSIVASLIAEFLIRALKKMKKLIDSKYKLNCNIDHHIGDKKDDETLPI